LKNSTVSFQIIWFFYILNFLCRSHIRFKNKILKKMIIGQNQGMWIIELSQHTSKEVRLSIGRRPRAIVAPCDGRNWQCLHFIATVIEFFFSY
jgi:hypothetical protein